MLLSPRALRYLSAYALLVCVIAIVALSCWPELGNQPLVLIALIPLLVVSTAYPSLRHLLRGSESGREEEGERDSPPDLAPSSRSSSASGLGDDEPSGLLDSPARQALFAATIATLVVVLALVGVLQPALDRG